MYGTVNHPPLFEEYVSLNQLEDLETPENDYCNNALNIATWVLAYASAIGAIYYLTFL